MSASCCAGSFSEAMAQRLQGSSCGRLPKLGRLPKSRHVRLHCIVTSKPLQKHTWQSAFGLGGSGRSSSQSKQISCLRSLSEGEPAPHSMRCNACGLPDVLQEAHLAVCLGCLRMEGYQRLTDLEVSKGPSIGARCSAELMP